MTLDDADRAEQGGHDVRWPWERRVALRPGISAVLRVRDEAHNLPWVLPPLLDAVEEVLLVDNRSSDGTAGVAEAIARDAGREDRLRVVDYPFEVSRCGAEHLATPAGSVHSLVHFYNYSFSLASTRFSLKWDGDMVLTREGVAAVRDLSWLLEARPAVVVFPHFPLYVEDDRVAWFDTVRQREPWLWPQAPGFEFVKGPAWEVRDQPPGTPQLTMPEGLCFEVKWLDRDEFAHWTDPGDFASAPLSRKSREHAVFTALRSGDADRLDGVRRVEAPAGVHVVDHVARAWLPGLPRPFGIARESVRASAVGDGSRAQA